MKISPFNISKKSQITTIHIMTHTILLSWHNLSNIILDHYFLDLIQHNQEILYLPWDKDSPWQDFDETVTWYNALSPKKRIFHNHFDENISSIDLLKYTYIFVDGWNPIDLVLSLTKRWYIHDLKTFLSLWWVFVWLSAWAILMTDNTSVLCYKKPDHTPLPCLWELNIQFFPHINRYDEPSWERAYEPLRQYLLKQSKTQTIYAAYDGGWIIQHNWKIEFMWKGVLFENWIEKIYE